MARLHDAGAEEVTDVVELDGHRYAVAPGPDRGQYVIARDGEQWWCFVRRDGDGNFIGSTVEGWLEPSFVAQIMARRGPRERARGNEVDGRERGP
jgi:hypothetical protein